MTERAKKNPTWIYALTSLLCACAFVFMLVFFTVHAVGDEQADGTHPWAIADEADYPMLINEATGATWVRACPGVAASCKWVPMRRESGHMAGEEP